MLRVTTFCFQTLAVVWNSSVHIIKTSLPFSESQPQSEPSRFIPLCHERSLRARKGHHVNLTLFQFANLSSCIYFFYRPSVLISSNNLFLAPVLQSCKCVPNMVFLPKLAAQEGFFPFLFSSVTKHLLSFGPAVITWTAAVSTRRWRWGWRWC